MGSETEPKLGAHVWPGANNILFVAVQNEVPLITELVRQLKKEHPRADVKGFILPMEERI